MVGFYDQEQNQNEEEIKKRYYSNHVDKKEYYDFDYTRGQYYYTYP